MEGSRRLTYERVSEGYYQFVLPLKPLSGPVTVHHLRLLSFNNLIYGSLFLIIGLVTILWPIFFSLVLAQFIGWILLIGGFSTIVHFLFVCGSPGSIGFILFGALHILVGAWLILEPTSGLISITLMITTWFLIQGVIKIFLSVSLRHFASWSLLLISGLISIGLAVIVLSVFPSSSEWILGVIVGADILFTGVCMLFISLVAYFALWAYDERNSLAEPFHQGRPTV